MNRGITFLFNGKEIWIHEAVVNAWVVTLIIAVLAIIINRKVKSTDFTEKPKGLLNVVEMLVEAIDGLTIQTMGVENLKFAPYMLSLAVFLAISNLSGLVGLVPPTSDYNVTLALALITFVMIHFFSLKTKGIGGYLKQFAEPIAVILPINILGEIATPISLSFRLFGNIISGALIMALVYQGLSTISALLIPFVAAPLHIYFDVFAGLLQTFIFVMLSMTYIKNNLGEN